MININKQSGFTVIEMLTTIVVTSLLSIVLMQILVLSIKANVDLETRTRYQNESYLISENIRDHIFDLQAQEIEEITDNASETVIEIRHLYDIIADENNIIVEDYSNPVTDTIRLDKTEGILYYNNERINDASVTLGPNTSLTLISVDANTCNLDTSACEEGVLELQLEMIVELSDGTTLAPQIFVTRIII